ncbi:hypothetical protein [Magnetovibrio blakemorei]|uniref:Uncharacterized protein n=1 Tax=Magnetovibrio blakemorei TaxID=28181 RepID=A0A1E5Q5X0_9PROT|nr:hypothetical protein [Magnetovibrio blakemorei]OEJ65703.1 hypothetical protein BEN30_13745 [Magnetovibrio blakemorei]
MFGFSFIKLIFTVAVVYAVWKAFQHFTRLQANREASARESVSRPQRKTSSAAKPPPASSPAQDGVEDMIECTVCKAYVTRGAQSCGRDDCPFTG